MCSFGSCQTRFEFLSQFRKVRNAFECFVTQVQTHLPKTKRVRPMKINVICTVCIGYSMTLMLYIIAVISNLINDMWVNKISGLGFHLIKKPVIILLL